jgi:hypothetical protein
VLGGGDENQGERETSRKGRGNKKDEREKKRRKKGTT